MKAGEMDETEEVFDVAFHRLTRRRKLCIQAKGRSTFQRLRYRRGWRPSWSMRLRPRRLGEISSMPYFVASFSSSRSES